MDRNAIITSNIKKYIKENGITQKQLSKSIGISPSTMSDYMNHRSNPSHGVIQKIADYFGILKSDIDTTYKEIHDESSINFIYDKLDKFRQNKVYSFAEKKLNEQNKIVSIEDYLTDSLIGYVSAGTGEFLSEKVHETIEIPRRIIPGEHYDMILQVNGNSMEPLFEDHEYIFVKKSEEIRSGQIGVFVIDGESYLKKAYIEDNHLRLVSLNKKYEDLQFNDVNDIKVIGTVVL